MITDNILIAHELIHSLHTKKLVQPFVATKLDITKAFDKIEWGFIEAIMKQMGFSEKWCNWIMTCITTTTYSILINGQPVRRIIPKRGIRQGDPISPYLYLLCTEGLSALIQASIKAKQLHGFKASRNGPAISHLLFAHDSLVFCKATLEECMTLVNVLKLYEKASGQAVNFQKSAILFGKGLDFRTSEQLSQLLGIYKTEGFGRYLGLPEFVGRNKTNAFSFIAQTMDQKMDNWYNKLLSPAGKEVLIKSIVTAIPTYSMSCFLLPMRLIHQITSAMRWFWWSNTKVKHKIPWVAWSKLNDPKKMGGLAIRDLKDFNIALLAKQSWRILQQPFSLMARVFKAKYFPKERLLDAKATSQSSYAWKSILHGTKLISRGLKYIAGNGNNIQLWKDNWLPLNPPRPPVGTCDSIYSQLKVSDLLIEGRWNEDLLCKLIHQNDIPHIRAIRPSITGANDAITWIYTHDGNYSVKSGYHLLRKLSQQQHASLPSPNEVSAQTVFTNIWKQNAPPKIKHFWWRSAHNALPTAGNLKRRRLITDDTCQRCGEASEDVNHLLFQCRVSKEIWEQAHIKLCPGDSLMSNSFNQNLESIQKLNQSARKDVSLFPFIGWRIWKMRNDLIFNNKRWSIPDSIQKALIDQQQWKESLNCNEQQQRKPQLHDSHNNKCYGGHLKTLRTLSKAQFVLRGMSSIPPTSTPLEAEAEALKLAMIHLQRLGYEDIIFHGDVAALFQPITRTTHSCEYSPIATFLRDIENIAADTNRLVFQKSHVSLILKLID
uniref:Putative non-LTR retroelement reverse transcriptase n=1 Tax=Arabidopsis thaliana TaxID=3702 RepID=Q9SHP2_ARATH|nr:putative non-LTR retroelement reverse transcriptase [Arabidopsis thaliana]